MAEKPSGEGSASGPIPDTLPHIEMGGTWRWTQVVGSAVVGSAIASLLTLVAHAVVLRTLPVVEAGEFVLLIALLQAVALLGTLGQPAMLLRVYSRQTQGYFDWTRDLRTTASISLLGVTAGAIGAGVIYMLPLPQVLFLVAAGGLVAALAAGAQILNSQRHYTWSAVLLRLPYSLMVLPAALSLVSRFARFDLMILSQLACAVGAAFIGVSLLKHRVGRGRAHILPRERVAGLVFLVSIVTAIVPMQGLVAIAGALMPSATLAAFAALSLLLRPFDLVRSVLQQILTTELVRGRRMSLLRMSVSLWGLASLFGLLALVAAPLLSRWVYAGRYDEALGILPWLTLAGVLSLTESLPRSYVLGRAPVAVMNRFVGAQLVIAILGIGVAIVLTQEHGILGTAVAGAVIYGARNLVAYGFLWREERDTPRNPLQAEGNSR